jgi:hypothetical protein
LAFTYISPLLWIAEQTMATNPRQGEREISEETRKRTEQMGNAARTVAETAERSTHAGAKAVQRGIEDATDTWQSGAETAARMAQRSMEQFSKMFGLGGEGLKETLQQSSNNVKTVMESTALMSSGLRDLAGEWMRFAESRLEHNLQQLDRIGECRSLHDCVALQTQIVRDNMQALLQSTCRTSERTSQIARAAVDRMSS